jgi:exodeoxyribonuclease VII small subunit
MAKAKSKPRPVDKLSYEQAFEELEALVEALETGELSLEGGLEIFERGQALAARCSGLLDKAQLRLSQLAPEEDDSLSPVDLELE